MSKRKKVLLINPALWVEDTPRYGLGMLSAVLTMRGHFVKVADYAFSRKTPAVKKIFSWFNPDVVGISMFSSAKPVWERMIDDIRSINKNVPILAGGPHVSVASDELIGNTKIDYLIVGEAETIISEVVEMAHREKHPVIVPRQPLPDVDSLPFPDYRTFIGYEEMRGYPLLTSRGCPYGCSFCAAGIVCSKKYRPRQIESVIEELKLAKIYKHVGSFFMYDDSFNINRERGKELLRRIIEARSRGDFNYLCSTGNFRADLVDEELLLLSKKLGIDEVWIGVESAAEEVFNMIKKGETLNDIEKTCQLVSKHGMRLILNFIIGLPGDSFEKNYSSILFARRFRAYKIFWNLLVVYKGTSAWDWFRKNGTVKEGEYPPAFTDDLFGLTPNAYTTNFSIEDRLNAWRLARIATAEAPLWTNLPLLYRLWRKYNVPIDIIGSYPIFRFNKFKMRWLSLLKLFLLSPRLFLLQVKLSLMLRLQKLQDLLKPKKL